MALLCVRWIIGNIYIICTVQIIIIRLLVWEWGKGWVPLFTLITVDNFGIHVCSQLIIIYRYCIDNGGMIAQAGIFAYQMNQVTPMCDATCTQR